MTETERRFLEKLEAVTPQSGMRREVMGEQDIFLSNLPAERVNRRRAFTVIAVSLLIFIAVLPFARLKLPEIWAFIPLYESALFISDLMTGILLFIHFAVLRSRAFLVLACGYLFTAVNNRSAPADLSRPVFGDRVARCGAAEHGLALHVLARHLSARRHRLRAAQESRCQNRAAAQIQPRHDHRECGRRSGNCDYARAGTFRRYRR
jgi:hypothetical protein